jgi:hypothetical protein
MVWCGMQAVKFSSVQNNVNSLVVAMFTRYGFARVCDFALALAASAVVNQRSEFKVCAKRPDSRGRRSDFPSREPNIPKLPHQAFCTTSLHTWT